MNFSGCGMAIDSEAVTVEETARIMTKTASNKPAARERRERATIAFDLYRRGLGESKRHAVSVGAARNT